MKSYLSLIPISAKIHKRRNRMTLFCIIIAVFLVTVIFSMMDMSLRKEKKDSIDKHGNWHIQLIDVPETIAEQIDARSDVSVVSWHDVINYDRTDGWYIEDKRAVLHGVDEKYITDIRNCLSEGTFPQNEREIILSPNAKEILDVEIGDNVLVNMPSGSVEYTICGFGEDDPAFNQLYDTISAYIDRTAFCNLCEMDSGQNPEPAYYIQFKDRVNIRKSIDDIRDQYGLTDENVDENTAVLAVTGFSSNVYVKNVYPGAAALFMVILAAGVLMISGSMNSSIAERSQFFGMLRCIGASKRQIICFVRVEALNWCKTAVPAGVTSGVAVTWGLCAVLRFGIGWEFNDMPLFGVSATGIAAGVMVGIVTVLLAAHAPAKRAAKVSPMEAVSGNTESMTNTGHVLKTRFCRVETAMGIHHAVSAKKNLVLMTGSFAISIILFLGFSAGLDFIKLLLPSLRPWQPDFTITNEDGSNSVDRNLADEIRSEPGVKHVFGNMAAVNVPAVSEKNVDMLTLVSYDEYLLNCAKDSMISGDLSKVYKDSNYVLTIYNISNPLEIGDKIQLDENILEVAGILSDGLFADGITLVCSEETFIRLTGEHDYGMLNVQFAGNASDANLNKVRGLIGSEYVLGDNRENNQMIVAEYWAVRLLVYSFLVIIAMITVLNIMNSISMSVSARVRQYGSMRAIGMDGRQLTRMIAAEVFTFAASGSIIGCALGLLFHRCLYEKLITSYFGESWKIPVVLLAVILVLVFFTTAVAAYVPSKRIRNMAITDTINEL